MPKHSNRPSRQPLRNRLAAIAVAVAATIETHRPEAGGTAVSADRHGWISCCAYRLPVAAVDTAIQVNALTDRARRAVSANHGIRASAARAHHHEGQRRRAGHQCPR
jgi:hypothetical protein